ncbi:MAG TPA: sulfotransferase [Steroidobacteraceae bacterium]|nr:sulfotransferase [Steroidobacteraceae bacterium]
MGPTSHRTSAPSEVEAWRREAQGALNVRDFRRAHVLCTQILQRDAAHADAMFMLGMIAVEHGNFGKAVEVIRRAIELDGGRPEYHAQLGRCLIALHQHQEALLAAQGGLALDPVDALTLDTLGVVMVRAGMHAEAVDPFQRAVNRDAGKASYHYNHGAALQIVGDFPAAQAALRRALAIEPDHYRAWSSLAQVSRGALRAEDVAHVQSLLKRLPAAASADDAQLHLHHALAKYFEDVGEYSKSFQSLLSGKVRKRAGLDYSRAIDQSLFAAVREVCAPSFLTSTSSGSESSEPIFIVGMPRTGTTLVERILSSHSDVYSAGELTNFALAIKRATRSPSNLVLDVPTLRASHSLDWRAIGDSYLASTRPRTGHTRHFIDKMPLNFLYAGFIRRALPNAKIVCVRRDPLDTCLSNYRQLFATHFPYYNYAYDLLDTGRYYVQFDALARYWRDTLGDHYCEVRYEDVVNDTEVQARRLVDFCGLTWDAACLNFHENAAPVATASSVQVRQPIYKTSMARWRHYEQELAPLRALLEEAGIALAPRSS